MQLCPPRAIHSFATSSLISLTKPITPTTLTKLRQALLSITPTPVESSTNYQAKRNAAVLIPFCNVNNEPGILFEVRAKTLRSHSGEVSFPGGRVDNDDSSFVHAALRETQEELGIDPSRVEILGEIGPPEINLRGDMRVWPIVGFVHSRSPHQEPLNENAPFPSIDMDALHKGTSKIEVGMVFHLPLAALTSPSRLRSSLFRGTEPYWPIDVTDLVTRLEVSGYASQQKITEEVVDEVGYGTEGRIEIWGLTGWYISLLMKALKIHQ